jgi:hypothetical protein
MNKGLANCVVVVMSAVVGTAPAWAHHSSAGFDATKTVSFEGRVAEMRWANPHVYLTVEQTTEAGATVAWSVEAVGPSALGRIGWTRDTVTVGDRVTLSGNPARDGDPRMNLGSLTHDDQTFNLNGLIREFTSAGTAPAAGATSLDGTWSVLANFALIGPYLPTGPKPAMTEAGSAAYAAFDEDTMLPALRCVASPPPFFMFILDVKRITTDGDTIRVLGDYEGAERTIHMNVADHAGATPSVLGHSIGHWEGETLVIDTTSFAPHAMGHAFGVPSGTQKHLVERLTRNADGTRIGYHFEVSDPEFLAAPLSGDAEWAYRPELELTLADCDAESARRFIAE